MLNLRLSRRDQSGHRHLRKAGKIIGPTGATSTIRQILRGVVIATDRRSSSVQVRAENAKVPFHNAFDTPTSASQVLRNRDRRQPTGVAALSDRYFTRRPCAGS